METFNTSVLSPLGIVITLGASILILIVPRKAAFLPFLISAFLVTAGQRIVIAGFDFTTIRVVIFFVFVRFFVRNEHQQSPLTRLDHGIVLYALVNMVAYIVSRGTIEALVNRLGSTYTILGLYFSLKLFVRDREDVIRFLRALSLFAIILSAFMMIEHLTGKNLFSIFGGVPEFTEVREGNRRSQGSFPHPLMAGAFGATLVPLMVMLLRGSRSDRALAIATIAAATSIVVTSATSGSLVALAGGLVAFAFWPQRRHMKYVRWGIVAMIFSLSAVMKAPVWALLGRLTIVPGSTGYHRYILVDAAIRHISEWWLVGTPSTAHWGWGLWDVTNQYVAEGVEGGLLGLALFLRLVYFCFSEIGRGIAYERRFIGQEIVLWSMGCALIAHLVAFLGMHYFGAQSYVGWYFLLVAVQAIDREPDETRSLSEYALGYSMQVTEPNGTVGS